MVALPLLAAMLLGAELLAAAPLRVTLALIMLATPVFLALLGHALVATIWVDTLDSWKLRGLDNDLSMRQRRCADKCQTGQGNANIHDETPLQRSRKNHGRTDWLLYGQCRPAYQFVI
jgi:hypothetical protein